MTAGSRTLTVLYATTALWLAYCTVNTWNQVPLWTSLVVTAASLVPCIAVVRESALAGERRTVAFLIERDCRRAAHRDELAEHQAADELSEACCERWWTTLATNHDPDCQHQTPRSNAA